MSDFLTFDYAGHGEPRQALDVFAANSSLDLRTAVLVFHGGAFQFGDREAIHPRCRSLAAAGVTAIAVGYRLADSATWPAQLDDASAAVQWVHDHADEIGIDPARIVVQGHSAGGLLALLIAGGATAAPRPAAVVAYYSPAALTMPPSPGDIPAPLLLGPAMSPDTAASASPIAHVDASFPPAIFLHGAADRFLSSIASRRLFDAVSAAGVVAEMHLIAGQDHEFDMTPRYADSASHAVVEFIRNQISEREQVADEVVASNLFVSMDPPPAGPPPGH
jgi:acetyl esterase/lipase